MRNVAIVGGGVSPFGRLDTLLYNEIGRPVVNDAIENASIDRKLIQSCYYGTCGGVGVGHEIIRGCCQSVRRIGHNGCERRPADRTYAHGVRFRAI